MSQAKYSTESRGAEASQASSQILLLTLLPSNITKWLEVGFTACQSTHGKFAIFFRTCEPYAPSLPKLTEEQLKVLNSEDDTTVPIPRVVELTGNETLDTLPDNIANADVTTVRSVISKAEIDEVKFLRSLELKRYQRELDEVREAAPKLFSFVMIRLSQASKNKLMEQAEWVKIDTDQDPYALMKLIHRTHRVGEGLVIELNISNADRAYMMISMSPNEAIIDHYRKHDEALKRLLSLGSPLPTPIKQAANFLTSLDKKRFYECVNTLENNVSQGITKFPETLDAALQYVTNFKGTASLAPHAPRAPPPSDRTPRGAVFNAKANGGRGGGGRGGANGGGKQAAASDPKHKGPRTREETVAAGKTPGPCSKCGSFEHWRRDCTVVKA